MFGMENTNSFAKLQKTLKKQGYFTTNMTNMTNTTDTTSGTPTDGTPNTTTHNSGAGAVNKNELLEKHLFAKGTFYYCSLHNWNPRTPIQYEEITKNAKFVLDKMALESWSREIPRFM